MALTAKRKQQFRDRLLAEREQTRGQLDELDAEIATLGMGQQVEGGGTGNHLADDATDVVEQERNLVLIANLRDRMREIDHAMERLDAGTYGSCERCGRTIGVERLDAKPFATLCIEDQAKEDQQRR